MGSRITRAIYKNQRNKPIKQQQEQSIKQLITYFVGGIINFFFFLFGYLFRPHLNNHNSLGIFLILILLFYILKLKQLNRATVFSSLLLIIVTIIAKFIGVKMMFLKSILILTTITLTSVISFEIGCNVMIQSIFLWLEYECFSMGVRLSLYVERIQVQVNNGEVGRQESMIAQLMFSVIGTMVVMLAVYGSKIMKIKQEVISKHMHFSQKFTVGCLNMVILLFSLSIKRQIQHEFLIKLYNILLSIIIIIILHNLKLFDYTWIIIISISIMSIILQIATESEPSLMIYLNKVISIALNLMLVDSLRRWLNQINYGNHRPFVVIFGYFVAIYMAQLSYGGIYLYEQLGYFLLYVLCLISYGGIIALNRYSQVDYEQVI